MSGDKLRPVRILPSEVQGNTAMWVECQANMVERYRGAGRRLEGEVACL